MTRVHHIEHGLGWADTTTASGAGVLVQFDKPPLSSWQGWKLVDTRDLDCDISS